MQLFQRKTKGATEFLKSANTANPSSPPPQGEADDGVTAASGGKSKGTPPDSSQIIELLGNESGLDFTEIAKRLKSTPLSLIHI